MSWAYIEEQTTDFLRRFHPSLSLPIPIEEIIEFQMGIDVVPTPHLMRAVNVDAITSQNLKQIHIDERQLREKVCRARFTLAHEVGHILLHQKFIQLQDFKSENQWHQFILRDLKRENLETEANLFASFLLMPKEKLEPEIHTKRESLLRRKRKKALSTSQLQKALIKSLANKFQVSEEAMAIRIKSINGWGVKLCKKTT